MRYRLLNRVFDTFLFYYGWVLCLNGVSQGNVFYGLLSISLIVFYRFYRSKRRRADCLLFVFVLFLGPLSDSLYAHFGVLKYKNLQPSIAGLPPLWIFFMWALLAVNIPLFTWLKRRQYLASILGACGGPLSYLSAVRLEDAVMLKSLPLMVIIIGGVWAFFLPFLLWLEDKVTAKFSD